MTGAAPIAKEILEFFYACGVPVMEGYGMTETATAATVNTPEEFRFGSVGKPVPGVEVKIGDDGEVLLRGPNIFQGYYKNEDATKEALEDGWLHTGDLGSVDEDGFLFITGRKKDIIITAGGKNITPANLENGLKQNQLDLAGGRDRRPPPLPRGADHARPRGGAQVRRAARPRGGQAARVRRDEGRRSRRSWTR